MKKLIITGRIIDGIGKEPISDGVIVINGNKIEQVGAREKIHIPKDVEVIDAGKGTILPGLIDAHIHLIGEISDNQEDWPLEPAIPKAIRAAAALPLLINAGFTAVRDVGGLGVYLRRAIEEGTIKDAPRISSSNQLLSQTAGHGDVRSLPLDFVKTCGASFRTCDRICDGADECRKAAREQFREGADFIKICTTGGVMSEGDSPNSSQFTMEEIRPIVEEARRVGSYVAAHAEGNEGIKNALKAGVRTIEHGNYLDEEAIELLLKNDAYLVPTISIINRICTDGEEYGVVEYGVKKAKMVQESLIESMKLAKKAGVKIATGTDFCHTPLMPFGENALELELFVNSLGFSPMEAIIAGTKISAETLRMDDTIGTLEKGKLADIIVVNGDPSTNISCLRNVDNIKIVIKDGVIRKNIL